MTCIVGLVQGKKVYLGADSMGSSGQDQWRRSDSKVFKNGSFVMAFTTSFRMGQLLQHKFKPPRHLSAKTVEEYMVTTFVDAIRKCFKNAGFATKTGRGEEQGGQFLVGYKGRLFTIEVDYQVAEQEQPYAAVGCGAQVALGSLHTSDGMGVTPNGRLLLALEAAQEHIALVVGPFRFVAGGK